MAEIDPMKAYFGKLERHLQEIKQQTGLSMGIDYHNLNTTIGKNSAKIFSGYGTMLKITDPDIVETLRKIDLELKLTEEEREERNDVLLELYCKKRIIESCKDNWLIFRMNYGAFGIDRLESELDKMEEVVNPNYHIDDEFAYHAALEIYNNITRPLSIEDSEEAAEDHLLTGDFAEAARNMSLYELMEVMASNSFVNNPRIEFYKQGNALKFRPDIQ